MIPPQYANQQVGISGYRVLNLDLDGVCADYNGALKNYCVSQGLMSPDVATVTDNYDIFENPGWPFSTREEYKAIHMAAESEGLYATMPAIPGVSHALHILASHDVHIRIVTHRLFVHGQHERVVQDTATWLEKNDIPYMSLCFTGLKDSIQATVHIDDSPANITTLREAGQKVVVFDQAYNRTFTGPRIKDWGDESVEYLLKLFDGVQ
ncbi:hypothetical protein ACFQY8_01410 [Alloscardovia venturai]|uniref:5'-nucleotidase n=1 Tax=Alloscardovia venturai TaxID=1769421 RepID=A0ABW2Y3R6_9BIFI